MAILKDPVLWLLAVASLLIAGPCEVYNMNMSTIIGSVSGSKFSQPDTVSQHVMVLSLTSTFARIGTGILFDRLGNLIHSQTDQGTARSGFFSSRIVLFLFPATIDFLGYMTLISGQWLRPYVRVMITTASVGLSYGSSCSLTPLTTLIWGQDGFAISWGIITMAPAVGIGISGLMFSEMYKRALILHPAQSEQFSHWNCYGVWATHCVIAVLVSIICVVLARWELKSRKIYI